MPMLPNNHGRILAYPAGLSYASKVMPDTAEMTNPVIIGACILLISKRATMTPNDPKLSHGHGRPTHDCNLDFHIS